MHNFEFIITLFQIIFGGPRWALKTDSATLVSTVISPKRISVFIDVSCPEVTEVLTFRPCLILISKFLTLTLTLRHWSMLIAVADSSR